MRTNEHSERPETTEHMADMWHEPSVVCLICHETLPDMDALALHRQNWHTVQSHVFHLAPA